jgi:hypothetical protein
MGSIYSSDAKESRILDILKLPYEHWLIVDADFEN